MTLFAAIWAVLFGIWPLADPGHDLGRGSPLVAIDVLVHVWGLWWLIMDWRLRGRRRQTTTSDVPPRADTGT